MQLSKIQDNRSEIQKLTRKELEYLARKEGRDDIEPGMPVGLMQQKFLLKPPAVMPRPIRGHLGTLKALRKPPYEEWLRVAFAPNRTPEPQVEVQEVSATEDLQRQWEAQKRPLTFNEMRQECKRRGIKLKRTDNMDVLRAKLNGQDPS